MSTATAAADPWNKRSLRHLLERTGEFATVVELVNSRGVITERGGSKVMQLARGLADLPGIHALSITDNPGGNAVLSADTLGFDLLSRGQDVIIHLSCKDWNRNGLQSHAWQLASEGFESILALSGDYPADGYSGRASGVFDIDSVGLLKMLSDMNQGLETRTPKGRRARMKRTDFFLGAVVNNYKRHEREVMPQYFKLAAKAAAGAAFRHQPDRLQRPQDGRADQVHGAQGDGRSGARQRLRPQRAGGALLPRRPHPRGGGSRTSCSPRSRGTPAAGTRARGSSSSSPPGSAPSPAASATAAPTSEATSNRMITRASSS